MSARYWVLISEELMASDPQWPASLRPIQEGEAPSPQNPGMRWWLLEDDDAAAELGGKRVDLTLGLEDGRPVVLSRSLMYR